MTSDWQTKGEAFGEFLKTIPEEERKRIGDDARAQAEADHQQFRTDFNEGRCSLCGNELSFFDEQKPCPHWLVNPTGFRKRHFPKLYEEYGFIRLQSYLRWVANEDGLR